MRYENTSFIVLDNGDDTIVNRTIPVGNEILFVGAILTAAGGSVSSQLHPRDDYRRSFQSSYEVLEDRVGHSALIQGF